MRRMDNAICAVSMLSGQRPLHMEHAAQVSTPKYS